jgi:sec-independent protein translocase protein TatC
MIEPVDATSPPSPASERDVESARMSFGDHLDELRSRLIRALAGVLLATILTLVFGKSIVEYICRPLWAVQLANGLQPQIQVLSPTAAFTTYMKISFLSGLTLAMPWVLYQVWMFVISGLYHKERRFVRLIVPISAGLFAFGVVFLYYVVLPIVLHFFINFNRTFGFDDLTPNWVQRVILPAVDGPAPATEAGEPVRLRLLREDPVDAQPGDAWVNVDRRRLVLKTNGGTWSIALDQGASAPMMQSLFAIDAYMSIVLVLALGFGLAFETPIVVFFLAWTGLATVASMAGARRVVILATVFMAAIITPPDPLSLMLLAVPMYGLFEAGLLAARWWASKHPPAVEGA